MNPVKVKTTSSSSEVILIAEGLTNGGSSRGICPRCKGGESQEKSFSVSRGVGGKCWYHCFRATCHYSGTLMLGGSDGVGRGSSPEPRKRRLRLFDRPIEDLTDEQVEWFRVVFDFTPNNDIYYCHSIDRYAWRVYGPEGQNRGWVLRAYDDRKPKSLAYPHRDEPFIGWFWGDQYPGVVVVEDLASARKVADAGMTSVALLGTHIDFERAYEIRRAAEGTIYLALDRGMLQTMISQRNRFEVVWGPTTIWQLDKDLKYVPRKRIREAVVDGRTNFLDDKPPEERVGGESFNCGLSCED